MSESCCFCQESFNLHDVNPKNSVFVKIGEYIYWFDIIENLWVKKKIYLQKELKVNSLNTVSIIIDLKNNTISKNLSRSYLDLSIVSSEIGTRKGEFRLVFCIIPKLILQLVLWKDHLIRGLTIFFNKESTY